MILATEIEKSAPLMTGRALTDGRPFTWAAWELPDGRVLTRSVVTFHNGRKGTYRVVWDDVDHLLRGMVVNGVQ